MKKLTLLWKGAVIAVPFGFLFAGGCGGGSSSGVTTPGATPTAIPTTTATPSGTPTSTPSGTPTGTPNATTTPAPTGTPAATPTATPTSNGTITPNLDFSNRVAFTSQGALQLLMNPNAGDASRGLNISFPGTRAAGQNRQASGPFVTYTSNFAGATYSAGGKSWQAVGGTITLSKYTSGAVVTGSPGQLEFQLNDVRMVPIAITGATGEFLINRTYSASSGNS